MLERLDALESSMTKLVKGLCQDMEKSTLNQLNAELSRAQTEIRSLKTDKVMLEQKIEGLKKDLRERDKTINSHICESRCDCEEKLTEAAVRAVEQDIQIEENTAENKKMQGEIGKLQLDLTAALRETENLRSSKTEVAETNATLLAQNTDLEQLLRTSRETVRSLEVQLQKATDEDNVKEKWTTVPVKPLKVKGEDNPLSNFFPCKIKAFGQVFDSLEHALQFKKLFDHDKQDEAADILGIKEPKDVKRHATTVLGTSVELQWEDHCDNTMRLLLSKKKDICPEFTEALRQSGDRDIRHNVASSEWGTGWHGKGKIRFGKILMDLRHEWFGNSAESRPTSQTPQPTPTAKPHVAIIGNSLTKGIIAEKVSKELTTTVKRAATIKDAKEVIETTTCKPEVIAFQLATNDVRDSQPDTVIQDFKSLVEATRVKLPQSKILVSLAPYKEDGSRQSSRLAIVNASLQEAYRGSEVVCISNRNIESFSRDSIHLTRFGTSQLVRNIKEATYTLLDMQAPATRYKGQNGYPHRKLRQGNHWGYQNYAWPRGYRRPR